MRRLRAVRPLLFWIKDKSMVEQNKIIINEIPSKTWSWCKMNKAEVSFESGLENFFPEVRGESGVEYTQNGTLLWDSLAETKGGVGSGADSLFDDALPVGIIAKKGSKVLAPVVLNYSFADGSRGVTSQVIKAEEDSEVTVIILSSSQKSGRGFQALKTKIVAKANSKVHVIKVQLLGDGFVQVCDTASCCDESAEVEVTHIVLGGAKTYVGVGSNLKEYKSSFKSDLAYYTRGNQELDLNYIVLQYGKKTDCVMNVYGTMNDQSKKTYRGTIDFKNGCAGSTGNEQEETLLLSPKVVNNSIPVILCDEEDVSGEHGASIGRLSEDMLFYMESRGISLEVAENLMARAKVQRVVNKIGDEKVCGQVEAFMDDLFGKI